MMTAEQAKEKTLERITKVAKEFIVNTVEQKIDAAIAFGEFSCTVKHNHNIAFQEAIVGLLEKEGFSILFGEGYYDISWERGR